MGNTVGRIVPPHASSLGKAVAAFQSEDVRDRLVRSYGIHRFTEHTVTDEVELKLEFERVRSRGYSTDEEESVLEGCCFGVAGPRRPRRRDCRDQHLGAEDAHRDEQLQQAAGGGSPPCDRSRRRRTAAARGSPLTPISA